jgi:protein TonB
MFDLITGATERPLQERSPASKALAVVVHVVVVGGLVAVALTQGAKVLPTAPTIMAFVAPPPAPPPPPPPAPAAPKAPHAVEPSKPTSTGELPAPVDAQPEARPEPDADRGVAGVEGGVEGGVVGGAIGGFVGGVMAEPPPPLPLPAPKAPDAPVRIGGVIHEPSLVRRVEPVYPSMASVAQLTGLVILEAVVDKTGCVESVKVLRSRHPLLDHAAIDALKQWQYTPLVLNGTPVSFVLTVTFNFSIQGQNRGH